MFFIWIFLNEQENDIDAAYGMKMMPPLSYANGKEGAFKAQMKLPTVSGGVSSGIAP
jgi:hypothetical protein